MPGEAAQQGFQIFPQKVLRPDAGRGRGRRTLPAAELFLLG